MMKMQPGVCVFLCDSDAQQELKSFTKGKEHIITSETNCFARNPEEKKDPLFVNRHLC